MGAILAEWSLAESMLASYYAMLASSLPFMGVPQSPAGWIVLETFDMVQNLPQRGKMLVAALERRHYEKETIDKFGKLFDKLRKTGTERIVSAHGRWGIDDAYPQALVWQRGAGQIDDALVYEPQDFAVALQAIADASAALIAFFNTEVVPKLHADQQSHLEAVRAHPEPEKSNE